MEVRGAPAIGCAAAFAAALAWRAKPSLFALRAALRAIGASRPTAVNLGAALHRIANAITSERDPLAEARALLDARIWPPAARIGAHGAALVPDDAVVLTHCNAGALATAGYGTALGVVRAAVAAGKKVRVLADETRPLLQGARLTAWELAQDGIPCEVIVDGAAAHFLSRGDVQLAIVGADRIARNGDVANKIGTAGVAAACHVFGVPFVVAAPTHDARSRPRHGRAASPIEERAPDEVAHRGRAGAASCPRASKVRNPVFDVTPARLVTAIVTEEGVSRPPFAFAAR